MNKKSIKYIGFYNLLDDKIVRNGSPAAINKMNYIIKTISKYRSVEIVSPSWCIEKNIPFIKSDKKILAEGIKLVLAPTFSTNNKVSNYIKYIFSSIWLFFYLLKNTHKYEEIVVYHSLAIMIPILLVVKIKKLNLILEVEEIYSDVIKCGNLKRYRELKFIKYANKYIFPTQLLNEKINNSNKPHVVIHGTYEVEKVRSFQFDDDRIHIVYAGTFDFRKGVIEAINSAKYLDEKYHMHIIGFGTDEEKSKVQEMILNVASITRCNITFDGLLLGEEYTKFIQACDVGLCTQIPEASYNSTSFPSKVLSYMANGLRVVAIKIQALEVSDVNELIYFYEENDSLQIAKRIMSIDWQEIYDSKNKIKELDNKLNKNLKKLLE